MTKIMTKEERQQSFTSAAVWPAKVIRHAGLAASVSDSGIIPPLPAQISPTNACNLNCPFCSCEGEDRSLEIGIDRMKVLLAKLAAFGCEALTITGGGEPMMYPYLAEMTALATRLGLEMGVVTNGLLLPEISEDILQRMTWIRVSHGDFRTFNDDYAQRFREAIARAPDVDWSISYVLGPQPAMNTLAKVIDFANEMELAHVRVVTDLHQSEDVPIVMTEKALIALGLNLERVIFQDRSQPECGTSECLIPYLKPVIHADGYVYPCCGAQYALNVNGKSMPESLRMGVMEDMAEIVRRSSSQPFDGGKCNNCYYGEYNRALKAMKQPIMHGKFI